jgi:putative endonuclease
MTTAAQRQALGAYGERVAASHLAGQGMVVLDRNWHCELGELDLVLRDGGVLVACEVKTRSSGVCW